MGGFTEKFAMQRYVLNWQVLATKGISREIAAENIFYYALQLRGGCMPTKILSYTLTCYEYLRLGFLLF